MSKFFVKFVPWNEKVLLNIINKTIKFSTVYEFNDFNEYRYICGGDINDETTLKILEKELSRNSFLNNLLTLSAEMCSEEYKEKIANFIKGGEVKRLLDPKGECLRLLQENLAFSSVGIFCVSALHVFENDSAQLMFAHYAENLKGIALIFEINNKLNEVNYVDRPKTSGGETVRHIEWYKSDYKDIEDFLYKSRNWGYEKESRIFDKPGITSAKEHNVILRAILYTPRFSGESKILSAINNSIYDGDLIIEAIYPSCSESYFMMEKNNEKTIDFLNHAFSFPQLPYFIIKQVESKDIEAMISLSRSKRLAYEKAQHKFWCYAGKEGDNSQRQWFKELLGDKNYLMFTAVRDCERSKAIQENNGPPQSHSLLCDDESVIGFIIGELIPASKVYNPSGLTLKIDDFCVRSENLWQSVGAELIKAIKAAAQREDATQIIVVCESHDHSKRKFLSEQNLSIASERFVGGIA